jgi:hypothetical protein
MNVLIILVNINFGLKLKFIEKMEFLQQMPAKASICEELNYHIPRVQT